MTDLRQAAQQALEALELHAKQYPHMQKGYTVDAITTLRTALEQQVEPVMLNGLTETETNATASVMGLTKQAEPVGEVIDERGEVDYISYVPPVGTALYTTPPQRHWVGLTDEDYLNALDWHPYEGTDREFWNVLEAKLKEKNSD